MQSKPDLVCGVVAGYAWEQIRPWVSSILQSGFKGDIILFANNTSPFAIDCCRNRNVEVVPFNIPADTPQWVLVSKYRYIPLLQFLTKHRTKYRNVIWTDVVDLIFQTNPSEWLESHTTESTIVASRVCWIIKDEDTFNCQEARRAFPADFWWLQNKEILCGGTLAGSIDAMIDALSKIFAITSVHPNFADQAVMNYVLHKAGNFPETTRIYIPNMSEGWAVVCSAFKTAGFWSTIGPDISHAQAVTDEIPDFDQKRGIVLTPDGKTPFAILHQYNRDPFWNHFISKKYAWD